MEQVEAARIEFANYTSGLSKIENRKAVHLICISMTECTHLHLLPHPCTCLQIRLMMFLDDSIRLSWMGLLLDSHCGETAGCQTISASSAYYSEHYCSPVLQSPFTPALSRSSKRTICAKDPHLIHHPID